MIETLVRIEPPYAFRPTMRSLSETGLHPPFARWVDDVLYKATSTPDGPATGAFERHAEGVRVRAWGPGADWLLANAPRWAGALDDPSTFVPRHPVVSTMHRKLAGLRLAHTHRVFDTVFYCVLGQRVTGRGAHESRRSLVYAYGEPAPGPVELHLVPDPSVIKQLGYFAFHPHNVERQRATILITAARVAFRLEQTTSMPLPDALARLRAVRGIGPWTAGLVSRCALGNPDGVAVGDYHLKNLVSFHLAGEPRATDERMLELLEPYAGQRARAVAYLKATGVGAPKYGARLGVNRITDR